jgi:hypothetical protein
VQIGSAVFAVDLYKKKKVKVNYGIVRKVFEVLLLAKDFSV